MIIKIVHHTIPNWQKRDLFLFLLIPLIFLKSKYLINIFLRGIQVATESITAKPYIIQSRTFYFNEFVANVLRDNIRSKKNQPLTSEKKN